MENVDTALETLVHNAIKEFGFAPRDVYRGVLVLSRTRELHTDAVRELKLPTLVSTIQLFTNTLSIEGLSHRVVGVYPRPSSPFSYHDDDKWVIDFKSTQIADQVMEKMEVEEDNFIQSAYCLLHNTSGASCFAGRYFEAFVHRKFSVGWKSDEATPQPIRMTPNNRDPPLFSTDAPSQSHSARTTRTTHTTRSTRSTHSTRSTRSTHPKLPPTPLQNTSRTSTRVNLTCDLSSVTLDDNRYYTSTSATLPLFDSFTINIEQHTAIISIFQITLSTRHHGSPEGYPIIRKIAAHVHGLLKERYPKTKVKVKVRYFLVCPASELGHQWQMPIGWSRNPRPQYLTHRGDVFCIHIPNSVHHSMSWLFTPNYVTTDLWLGIVTSSRQ